MYLLLLRWYSFLIEKLGKTSKSIKEIVGVRVEDGIPIQ